MPELNYSSFSWRIIDGITATKQCDKSFFGYDGTGVPKDIRWFFSAEKMAPGDRKDITIVYGDKSYAAYLIVDRYDEYGRLRLFWESSLGHLLDAFKDVTPYSLALFQRALAQGSIIEDTYNLRMLVGTERLEYLPPTEWILSCNPKVYDAANAFYDLINVDWHQNRQLRNVAVNDIVYIYTATPVKAITHMCIVNKVNVPSLEIPDAKYYVGDQKDFPNGPYIELQCIREFDALPGLTFEELKKHGLTGNLQGSIRLKGELRDYIGQMCDEQAAVERIHGGNEHYTGIPRNLDTSEDDAIAHQLPDDALEQVAKQHESEVVPIRTVTTNQYQRNSFIAENAKRRANGHCQLCGKPAPFTYADGKPYLESHHIIWLANGGADTIDNTVALCPNCHRKIHVLNDPKDVAKLIKVNKQ